MKYNDTSVSMFRLQEGGPIGVCTDCPYWNLAAKYHMEERLPANTVIQLEMIGKKINGNDHQISGENEGRLFAVIDLTTRTYSTSLWKL
jgi:hypothetical protein